MDRLADRRGRAARRGAPRDEVRRQADRAGPGALGRRTARTAGRSPCRRLGVILHVHVRARPAAARSSAARAASSTRSSVRRHGTYAAVSQPSSGSSNSLVRNTASSRLAFQTSRSHASPSCRWSARSSSSPIVPGVIRSCGNRWKVRAISNSQEYWTVESIRSRYSARFGHAGVGVELGGDPLGGHPRRVGEFSIVVIAQDLIEMARGRAGAGRCGCAGRRSATAPSPRRARGPFGRPVLSESGMIGRQVMRFESGHRCVIGRATRSGQASRSAPRLARVSRGARPR